MVSECDAFFFFFLQKMLYFWLNKSTIIFICIYLKNNNKTIYSKYFSYELYIKYVPKKKCAMKDACLIDYKLHVLSLSLSLSHIKIWK